MQSSRYLNLTLVKFSEMPCGPAISLNDECARHGVVLDLARPEYVFVSWLVIDIFDELLKIQDDGVATMDFFIVPVLPPNKLSFKRYLFSLITTGYPSIFSRSSSVTSCGKTSNSR